MYLEMEEILDAIKVCLFILQTKRGSKLHTPEYEMQVVLSQFLYILSIYHTVPLFLKIALETNGVFSPQYDYIP